MVPGNVFPATESPFIQNQNQTVTNPKGLYAKDCVSGYQSHYCLGLLLLIVFFLSACKAINLNK